jgi:hypothetical protein
MILPKRITTFLIIMNTLELVVVLVVVIVVEVVVVILGVE